MDTEDKHAVPVDLDGIARYRRDGYVVVRQVLSREHVDACLAALTALATDPELEAGRRDASGAFIALEPAADPAVATAVNRADLIRKFGDFTDASPALAPRGDVGAAARRARRADGAGAGAAAGDGAGEAAQGQRREALAPGRGLFPRQRPQSDVRRLDRARPRDARERLHGGHSRIASPRARPARAGPRHQPLHHQARSGPAGRPPSPCPWILAMRWSSTA